MAETPKRTEFRVEPLGPGHNRSEFSCGVAALDNYIRMQARQDARHRVAVVFVLTPDGKTIAGFYALSQFSVHLTMLPDGIARKLPKYPRVLATLIGRLAVGIAFRGQGLGEFLLKDALYRCLKGSKHIGSYAVIVDAKDEDAAAFYRKYGFIDLPTDPLRLFLPMETIEQMFA